MVRVAPVVDWHAGCDGSLPIPADAGLIRGGIDMDKDRIEGPLKEAGGKVKEEWGDVTDDTSTEAEGQMDQVEGKVQNEWGEAKDEARDAVDDVDDANRR
jgi:uncharacterized protein YjbJ (UPF0337 family)